VHAKYDRDTQRAYIELRDMDDDGGDAIATAIFSFRMIEDLTKRQVEQEAVRTGPGRRRQARRSERIVPNLLSRWTSSASNRRAARNQSLWFG
jgi:hypothetical protein